jgi:MYXO-CTERM domain-containing protein
LLYSYDLGVQAGGQVKYDNIGIHVHAQADSEADGYGVHAHAYSQIISPPVSGNYAAGAISTASATYSDMKVNGPVGTMISTSLNMNLSGGLLYSSGADPGSIGDAETQAVISVYVNGTFVGTGGVYERFETQFGQYIHDTGMLSAWDSGNTGIVTPSFTVQSGVPFEVKLILTASSHTEVNFGSGGGGTAEANTGFSHTLAFALDGPVFNLPVGYTADSADAHIVDNSFVAPEPSSLVLAFLGLAALLLVPRRRKG